LDRADGFDRKVRMAPAAPGRYIRLHEFAKEGE